VPTSTIRTRAAHWVAGADPSGLLYGAIVTAAVLAAVSAHDDDSKRVVLTTAGFLVVYWMAHVYIATLSTQFEGDTRAFLPRLLVASRHETGVLKGGVPALVIYLVAYVAVRDVSDAAAVAVYSSVVLLMVFGYLGAHRAGLRGRAMAGEVAGAACFGVLIVIGKSLLH
jgi:hypothetical protein